MSLGQQLVLQHCQAVSTSQGCKWEDKLRWVSPIPSKVLALVQKKNGPLGAEESLEAAPALLQGFGAPLGAACMHRSCLFRITSCTGISSGN